MQSETNHIYEAFGLLVKINDESIKKTFGNYRKGFITEDELKWTIRKTFDAYFMFLWGQGIRTRLSSKTWSGFLSDHEIWLKKMLLSGGDETPWLVSRSTNSGVFQAASGVEKELFFKIMEICQFPVMYYEPTPEHIPIPDMRITTYGSGNIWDIVDDGGLVGDPAPIGKTFILTDKYGLKTSFVIQQQGLDDRRNECDYFGYGTIEGYTSEKPVKIKIYLQDGKVDDLRVEIDHSLQHEHNHVFESFPLWQDYLERIKKKNSIYENCAEKFFERCYKEEFGE